jgi:peroxiredoxin
MQSDTAPIQGVEVGMPAPDFTLPGTSGKPFTLSSYRGKENVLLAFFPAAFTSVCSAEMCAFHEDVEEFQSVGTRVFGISVDLIPSLREFRYQLGIETELLSDFRRDASRTYGVLEEERYQARRAYFLVDKQGVLRWKHIEEDGDERRPNAEILAEIEKLER